MTEPSLKVMLILNFNKSVSHSHSLCTFLLTDWLKNARTPRSAMASIQDTVVSQSPNQPQVDTSPQVVSTQRQDSSQEVFGIVFTTRIYTWLKKHSHSVKILLLYLMFNSFHDYYCIGYTCICMYVLRQIMIMLCCYVMFNSFLFLGTILSCIKMMLTILMHTEMHVKY